MDSYPAFYLDKMDLFSSPMTSLAASLSRCYNAISLKSSESQFTGGTMQNKKTWVIVPFLIFLAIIGCSLPKSISSRLAAGPKETPTYTRTPRPTFTATPLYTATPTSTNTPVATSTPINTPTPLETATFTPAPPTDTSTPAPAPKPKATATPGPPTDTPAPSFPFKLAGQADPTYTHTTVNSVMIIIEIFDKDQKTWVQGLKPMMEVPGIGTISGPNSAFSCPSNDCKTAGRCIKESYCKQGNTWLEYNQFISGPWVIYLVDGSGAKVSESVTINMNSDPAQWQWYYLKFVKQ
jgi:hypothetical protein